MLTPAQIAENYRAALEQAARFSMGTADVQKAAVRLARALEELGISYAIAGGLAVAAHGHVRLTVDVDVLLTEEGLREFKQHRLGRGWVERFPGSRGLRDTEVGVDIDVLLTGGFPGDGKPKEVCFPDPVAASQDVEGTRILSLDRLIELKVASGMTAPHRLQDLADVVSLIRVNRLGEEFSDRLAPSVREKFHELRRLAQVSDEERP